MSAMQLPHTWVDSDASLESAARRWAGASVVGVDIEFVRFNTYYPQAAIYQIATDEAIDLVDATAIEQFAPLIDLLDAAHVLKVVHGGGEDMEVIHTHLGMTPRNVFDTQLAACIAGHVWCIGYAALVSARLGVELSKEAQRSDWLARPLSQQQREYCLQDVAYLIELQNILRREIERLGRLDWFEQEMRHWLLRESAVPEDRYLRMAGVRQMTSRQQAVLKALCEWREHEAMRIDQPRQWVVRDEHLLKFARQDSLDRNAIGQALPPRVARRFGRGLLDAFNAGQAGELPTEVLRPFAKGSREIVKSILKGVTKLAQELNVPPELLGRRREIERCVRAWQSGDRQPDYLSGWRGCYLRSLFDAAFDAEQCV